MEQVIVAPDETEVKPNPNDELAESLVVLIGWLRAHPELPPFSAVVHYWHYNADTARERMATCARAMADMGRVAKEITDYDVKLHVKLGAVDVNVSTSRKNVCRQVEVTKTVLEWECDPLLGGDDDAS